MPTHHLPGKHNLVLLLIHKYELGEHLIIKTIHKINSSFFKQSVEIGVELLNYRAK